MGHRLSKIYTKTGDQGTTGLGDGTRVDKDEIRVEAYGTVDELNSAIGMILTISTIPLDVKNCLIKIQNQLFDLGSELCLPGYLAITEAMVTALETTLDKFNEQLPPLKEFILPGGSTAGAYCHLARTICRRAERRVVSLKKVAEINPFGLVYLNRLSDLLFVIARVLVRAEGGNEVLWQHERRK